MRRPGCDHREPDHTIWSVETLAREPGAVQLPPRGLASRKIRPLAQQLLEHPITGRHPRAAQIITRPQEVSEPLELGGRGMYEPQQPGAIQ